MRKYIIGIAVAMLLLSNLFVLQNEISVEADPAYERFKVVLNWDEADIYDDYYNGTYFTIDENYFGSDSRFIENTGENGSYSKFLRYNDSGNVDLVINVTDHVRTNNLFITDVYIYMRLDQSVNDSIPLKILVGNNSESAVDIHMGCMISEDTVNTSRVNVTSINVADDSGDAAETDDKLEKDQHDNETMIVRMQWEYKDYVGVYAGGNGTSAHVNGTQYVTGGGLEVSDYIRFFSSGDNFDFDIYYIVVTFTSDYRHKSFVDPGTGGIRGSGRGRDWETFTRSNHPNNWYASNSMATRTTEVNDRNGFQMQFSPSTAIPDWNTLNFPIEAEHFECVLWVEDFPGGWSASHVANNFILFNVDLGSGQDITYGTPDNVQYMASWDGKVVYLLEWDLLAYPTPLGWQDVSETDVIKYEFLTIYGGTDYYIYTPRHESYSDYNNDGANSHATGWWNPFPTAMSVDVGYNRDTVSLLWGNQGAPPPQPGVYDISIVPGPYYPDQTYQVTFEETSGTAGQMGEYEILDPSSNVHYQGDIIVGQAKVVDWIPDEQGIWTFRCQDWGDDWQQPNMEMRTENVQPTPTGDNLYMTNIQPDPPATYGDDVMFSVTMTSQWQVGIIGNMQVLRPDNSVEYSVDIPVVGTPFPYILQSTDPDYVAGVWTVRVKDSDDTWTGTSVESQTTTIPADNPATPGTYTITFPVSNETLWFENQEIDICSTDPSATTQGLWEIRKESNNVYMQGGDVDIGSCRELNFVVGTQYDEGYYYVRVRDQGGAWGDGNVKNETFYVQAVPTDQYWYIRSEERFYYPFDTLDFVVRIPETQYGVVMIKEPDGDVWPVSLRMQGNGSYMNKTAMWVLIDPGRYQLQLMSFNATFPGVVSSDVFDVIVGGQYLRTNKFDGQYQYGLPVEFVGYHSFPDTSKTELVVFLQGQEYKRFDISYQQIFSRSIHTRNYGDGAAWIENGGVMVEGTYVQYDIGDPPLELTEEYLGVSVGVWFVIIGGCVIGALILIPYKVTGEFNAMISGLFAVIGLGINIYLTLWPLWIAFLVGLLVVVYFIYKAQRS